MADFYGCLESTSFRVKDKAAFLADPGVQRIQQEALSEGFFDEDPDGYFAFGWYGQYPSVVLTDWNQETNEETETDITDVIQRYILPGDVCRIGVSGSEKLRYIGGQITWVTSKGTAYFEGTTEWSEKIDLNTLKAQAAEFSTGIATIV